VSATVIPSEPDVVDRTFHRRLQRPPALLGKERHRRQLCLVEQWITGSARDRRRRERNERIIVNLPGLKGNQPIDVCNATPHAVGCTE
jgi:hypothetical protein